MRIPRAWIFLVIIFIILLSGCNNSVGKTGNSTPQNTSQSTITSPGQTENAGAITPNSTETNTINPNNTPNTQTSSQGTSNKEQGQELGNTIGNLVLGGYAALNDGWIYYLGHTPGQSADPDNTLYKMKEDGSSSSKLNEDGPNFINVIGGWIYYTDSFENPGIGGSGSIYKVKTDGTDRTKLIDDSCRMIFVTGEWIYYINRTDNSRIYKMKTDGSSITKLNDDETWEMFLGENCIFYNSNNNIYSINLDGSAKSLIIKNANNINYDNGFLYFINTEDNKIYKIKPDSKDTTVAITDNLANSINVYKGWVYFTDETDSLCKIKIDGTNKQVLNPDSCGGISIVDDWIFFHQLGADTNHLFRIRTDGTNLEDLEK